MLEKTFKIYTLGCKVNHYDSGVLKSALKSAGFDLRPENAGLVIINTCAVTLSAIHKNKRMLNKARQENPSAKIIILGCWVQADKEMAEKSGADAIFSSKDGQELVSFLHSQFFGNAPVLSKAPGMNPADRARYFIKIQDGCEQYCSYCLVPFARGKYQSRNEEEILTEIKLALDFGYQEIVLSGVHLGMYGKEENSRAEAGLNELIKKILKIHNLGRIRLSSIEVNEVDAELIDLIRGNRKICPHLHIPLQSGTNKILRLMNRPYDTAFFWNKIRALRKAVPDIALSTDVIVGFPGESRIDFEETVNFIKKCRFSRLHVFSFSAHRRTKAFLFSGQIGTTEIAKRSKILRQLGLELEKKHEKLYEGRELTVLIEKQSDGAYSGKCEYYFNVDFIENNVLNWLGAAADKQSIRRLVRVKK